MTQVKLSNPGYVGKIGGPLLYLAGPMTGLPDYNFPAFNKAADYFRRKYRVFNPAATGVVEGANWGDYIKFCLPWIFMADRVFLLPGWQESKGATFEALVAEVLDVKLVAEIKQGVLYPLDFVPLDKATPILEAFYERWAGELLPDPVLKPMEVEETMNVNPDPPHGPFGPFGLGPVADDEADQKPRTILDEAAEVTSGDRNHFYGHPGDNHGCTAKLWSTWLSRRHRTPIALTAADVCWLNILQKTSREANRSKRDNLVDVAGYARNVEQIEERTLEKIREVEKEIDESLKASRGGDVA